MKPLSAGSEVDAWCTRCRLDLGHRIVAMVGGKPKVVICQTCGSRHNYRSPRATGGNNEPVRREPASPKRSSPRSRAEQERLVQWETRVGGQVTQAFARYSMDRRFRLGELIVHRKFGEGYVDRVLEDGKISVMFRDGSRTLAHAHG
ncbi:MAG TPA: hypothetical protein VGJ84_05390 [Polyangiaceae bacterium]|jgi:hypothetical protein